ncbi:MAG: glycosyltransferase [Opitutaceae bacterium]|nr:glycosyltransferase [Opitutaceae bacterium]
MTRELLSIVTISRNDRNGLSRTLESVSRIMPLGAQHVVVDGGDEAVCHSSELLRGDEVIYVRQSGQGISNAFNEGLDSSSGEWVWFVNGGDAVHENLDASWLFTHLAQTRANVVFGTIQFDDEAKPREMPLLKQQWPLLVCWPLHPGAIVRRRVLLEAGGFHQRWRVAMDYDFWFRALNRHSRVDVISVCLARFDTKGISERPETRRLAKREAAQVLLLHSGAAFRDIICLLARASWKWLRALGTLLGIP